MRGTDDPAILGYALASALGPDLASALEGITAPVAPTRTELAPGVDYPRFTLTGDDPRHDWYENAALRVRRVVADAAPAVDRTAPLFVASSSLNVGAFEQNDEAHGDCQAFAEQVAAWLDWRGPVAWVGTACTAGLNALLAARRLLRAGAVGEALVLGIELPNRFSARGFAGMQLLDPERCRPLAAGRQGLVLGEAVAAIHLGRGPARWRLRGGANEIDGRDPAGAASDAVATMCRRALADAGLSPAEIGLVKLQAAGSPHNDAAEIAGLAEVFSPLPPLATLKPLIGHTLGAAGVAETALLLALYENGRPLAPPAAAGDPDIPAALAPRLPAARYLLATILGFGGGHAAVVIEDGGEPAGEGAGDRRLPGRGTVMRPSSDDAPAEAAADPASSQAARSGTTRAEATSTDETRRTPEAPGGLCLPEGWRLLGRHDAAPPPADWRERLAARLGQRPRRIGHWAELALYGALACLDDAGETTLPAGTRISVATTRGPAQALAAALAEARDDLPLPIGFLQSQPGQLLPTLAQHLGWTGDARLLSTRDPQTALDLALAEHAADAAPAELLLGWVEESGGGTTHWLRLRSAPPHRRAGQPGARG